MKSLKQVAMLNLTEKQMVLAEILTRNIENSGCNPLEVAEIMGELISAILGRHTPVATELRAVCSALGLVIINRAAEYQNVSDLKDETIFSKSSILRRTEPIVQI
ncbi:hypothetical protein [Muribaculum intestinale]|uniref:hypothetical protein n=1 Tax=Muribaculum intestinale TaxID=1796646 RepID=UPI0025A9E6BF|nr:hypothetical protein [Muribaculum intestinale]